MSTELGHAISDALTGSGAPSYAACRVHATEALDHMTRDSSGRVNLQLRIVGSDDHFKCSCGAQATYFVRGMPLLSIKIDVNSEAWRELYDHVVTDDTRRRFELSFDLPKSKVQVRVDGGVWTRPLSMVAPA